MKLSLRALAPLCLLFLALARPALATDRTFYLEWEGTSFVIGGVLVIDDTQLANPGDNCWDGGSGRCTTAGHPPSTDWVKSFDLTLDVGSGPFTATKDNVAYLRLFLEGAAPYDLDFDLPGQHGWATAGAGALDLEMLPGLNLTVRPFAPFALRVQAIATVQVLTISEVSARVTLPLRNAGLLGCSRALAKASRAYHDARVKVLSRCNEALARGKAVYADADKSSVVTKPSQCPLEVKAVDKIAKAAALARKTIADPARPACDDDLVARLHLCADTVDGLITPDAADGCQLEAIDADADRLIADLYPY